MRRCWASGAGVLLVSASACLSSADLSGSPPPDNKAPLPAAPTCNADLKTDVGNCGQCGKVCGNHANAYGVCKDGKCGVGCNTGFGDCNGNADDGCEATLASDSIHCGACGHSCLGARCVAGQCQPVTLGEIPGTISGLVGDATALYYGYSGGASNHAIGTMSKDGAKAHVDVVNGLTEYVYSLAVNATDFFWLKYDSATAGNPSNGAIYKSSKTVPANAPAPWLAGLNVSGATPVLVGDTAIFYHTTYAPVPGTIVRAQLANGAKSSVAVNLKGGPLALVMDASFVYYALAGDSGASFAGRGMYRCATSGCGTGTLIDGVPTDRNFYYVAQDAQYLYFTVSSRGIGRVKKGGGDYAVLTSPDDSPRSIDQVVSDGTRLYWIEHHYANGPSGSDEYFVRTCPLAACADAAVDIAVRGRPIGLVVDDKALYIGTNATTNSGGATSGIVMRVVK